MSDEKMSLVEAKHKELSDLVQKKAEYLNQTKIAISQLRAERKKALREVAELGGARDAYGSVINLFNPPKVEEEVVVAEPVDAPPEPVVSEPVTVDAVAEVVA